MPGPRKRPMSHGVSPQLQVFKVPKTDHTITACRYVPIKPTMTGVNPMEFVVPATQTFIDMDRSYFLIKFKLKKANNTDVAAADKLYVTPNLAHNLFRQIQVLINGTPLESKTDDYAYKAYFIDLLNTDKEEGETFMKMQGWYNEVNFPDHIDANFGGTAFAADDHDDYTGEILTQSQRDAVEAMKRETNPLRGGTWKEYFLRPHNPIFRTGKALIPDQEITFQLYFNEPAWYLLSEEGGIVNGKAITENEIKIEFVTCQLTVDPGIKNAIQSSRLRSHNAVYPFHSSRLRTFSMAAGITEFDEGKLFNERIPLRMFIGLLHQDAYNGSMIRNPVCFQKFGVTRVSITVNGEEYPYKDVLELNSGDGDKDDEGYRRFLDAAGTLKVPGLIKREMWGHYKDFDHDGDALIHKSGTQTIFGVNFAPDGKVDSPDFHPLQVGNVRIRIKFNAALAHVVIVMLYAEFENFMEISNNEGVQYNDTS